MENRADVIAGIDLSEEPTDVADILIDLAQRETKSFSNRFARMVVGEMKSVARLHKKPLKSAGFRVLQARRTCPRCWSSSVMCRTRPISSSGLRQPGGRGRCGSLAQAVDVFFAKRVSPRTGTVQTENKALRERGVKP